MSKRQVQGADHWGLDFRIGSSGASSARGMGRSSLRAFGNGTTGPWRRHCNASGTGQYPEGSRRRDEGCRGNSQSANRLQCYRRNYRHLAAAYGHDLLGSTARVVPPSATA